MASATDPAIGDGLARRVVRALWDTVRWVILARGSPNRYAVKRACELSSPRELLRLYRHSSVARFRVSRM